MSLWNGHLQKYLKAILWLSSKAIMRFTDELLPRKKMTKYHRFLWLIQTFCLSIVCKILGSISLDTFHAFYREIVLYLRKCSTQLLKREAALRYLPCLLSRDCTLFGGMLYTVGGCCGGWQDKVTWLGFLFVGGQGSITFHRALRICLWAPLLALVLVLSADYAVGVVHWDLLVSSLFGVGLLSRGVGVFGAGKGGHVKLDGANGLDIYFCGIFDYFLKGYWVLGSISIKYWIFSDIV